MKGFLRMMKHDGLLPVTYHFVMAEYDSVAKKTQRQKQQKKKWVYNELTSQEKTKTLLYRRNSLCRLRKVTKKSFAQGSCYTCF